MKKLYDEQADTEYTAQCQRVWSKMVLTNLKLLKGKQNGETIFSVRRYDIYIP